MTIVQKVNLSLNSIVFERFKKLAKNRGLSISSWVTAKMVKELQKEKSFQVDQVFDLLTQLEPEQREKLFKHFSKE